VSPLRKAGFGARSTPEDSCCGVFFAASPQETLHKAGLDHRSEGQNIVRFIVYVPPFKPTSQVCYNRPMFEPVSPETKADIFNFLEKSGQLNVDYIMMVVLSCIIASFGLILNSAAVIIGAMLIAPLMVPILRCSVGLIFGNYKRTLRAFGTLAMGVLLSIVLSAILGQLVSIGAVNFLEELPGEVMSRTRPNLFDMIVALAGGTAAAYALSQPNLSSAIAGVAISTALMPPLCTVGIGLSQGSLQVSGGALLLFTVNFVAIVFASSVTFFVVGVRPTHQNRIVHFSRALIFQGILVLVVATVLVSTMVGIIREAKETSTIRQTIMAELDDMGQNTLVSFDRFPREDHLEIVVTIRSSDEMSFAEANAIQEALAAELQKTVSLKLLVIPIASLDPMIPPTLTPTPPPQATFTPTPLPTATPTITPTPTLPPTPTPIPKPTFTPVPSPTPISYAVIGATTGYSTTMYRQPERSELVGYVPDGMLVQRTGQRAVVGITIWSEVVLPDGRVGWISERHMVPYKVFVLP